MFHWASGAKQLGWVEHVRNPSPCCRCSGPFSESPAIIVILNMVTRWVSLRSSHPAGCCATPSFLRDRRRHQRNPAHADREGIVREIGVM